MNKFLKFNLFNNFEVSIKLSQIIPVQRMCTEYVKDKKIVSNTARSEEDSYFSQTENSLINYNANFQFWSPRDYFSYHPFYSQYHCNFNNQPYNYPQNYCQPQFFHTGFPQLQKRTLAEKIMSIRTWDRVVDNPGIKPGFIFTLMSYNVLAQDLLEQHPFLYKRHESESLIWTNRWNNLFNEILRFKPDILCLQEVQESHLLSYYYLLETIGYQSIFKKRTGNQPDGCAIYYKVDNISLIDYSIVEYFQPSVPLLNRDNVGIVMKFVPKLHPTREFVVATTHLLYNPNRDDVRMAQMQLLLTDIEKMSYKRDAKLSEYLPVILTGDLNSPPYSNLYDFVTKGSINYENLSPRLLESRHDCSKILVTSFLGITDNCQHRETVEMREKQNFIHRKCHIQTENSCSANKKLSHNFNFKSVYNHGLRENQEATSYQNEWLTVDYIFYSKKKGDMHPEDKLKLLSRFRLPTSQELNGVTIPNHILGSDHLSLVAKFKLEF